MIYPKIKNIETYLGISKNLDTAIRFLREYDLNDLGKGKTVIDQDEVFVNHFCYQTVEEKDASWEGHIRYADMHILLSGNEKIGISNCEDLSETERDEEKDFVGYDGKVTTWVLMDNAKVLIVFPEDVHMVKVKNTENSDVDKLVFKIKIK